MESLRNGISITMLPIQLMGLNDCPEKNNRAKAKLNVTLKPLWYLEKSPIIDFNIFVSVGEGIKIPGREDSNNDSPKVLTSQKVFNAEVTHDAR